MNNTKIEWVLNPDGTPGYTWNPITGCLNGCTYCYARKLANTRLKERYLANDNVAIKGFDIVYIDGKDPKFTDPFYPRSWFDRREPALESKKAKGIFVCDMSDLFGIGIPKEWTQHVKNLISLSPQHRFYLLTKQPQNLIKFIPFPDNCWVGVTATDTPSYQDAYRYLGEIEAKVRYISFEPLLGAIYTQGLNSIPPYSNPRGFPFDWVIIGACTGTKIAMMKLIEENPSLTLMPFGTKWTAQPRLEWVKQIVDACDKARIPVFLKDNLKSLLQQNKHNLYSFPEWAGKQIAVTGDHSLAPTNPHPNEPMRLLRQEMPEEIIHA